MDKIEERIERMVSLFKEVMEINNETATLLKEVIQLPDKSNYAKYSEKYNAIQEKARILSEN